MLNITSYAKLRMVEWYTSKYPASQLYFLGISTRLKFIPSQKNTAVIAMYPTSAQRMTGRMDLD